MERKSKKPKNKKANEKLPQVFNSNSSSFNLPSRVNLNGVIISSQSTCRNEKSFMTFDDIQLEENLELKFSQEENQFQRLKKQLIFNKIQKKKISEFINTSRKKAFEKLLTKQNKLLKERLLPIYQYNLKEYEKDEDDTAIHSKGKNDFNKSREVSEMEYGNIKSFKIFWKYEKDSTWKPSHREGATLTAFDNQVILYGGICGGVINSVVSMNRAFQWKEEHPEGIPPLDGRSGHTALAWKRGILIFGGEKTFNKVLKMRDCFSDVKYLAISPLEWRTLRVGGEIIEGRRNHSACIVSKYMIVHGGINNYGKTLSEFLAFNIEAIKWETIEANRDIPLAFHTMACSFKAEIKLNSLYSTFEYKKERRVRKIKEEGIYIFGGKKPDGRCSNDIWVANIGDRPLKWIQPAIKGIPPSPRYLHSMTHFDDLNILVIYGGRIDQNSFGQKVSNFILSDLHVLELENLEWCSVSSFGIPNPRRFNHSSCRFGTKLLIYGGIDFGENVNSNLIVVEFDQRLARKIYQEYNSNEPVEDSFDIKNDQREKDLLLRKSSRTDSKITSFLPMPLKQSEIHAIHQAPKRLSMINTGLKRQSTRIII